MGVEQLTPERCRRAQELGSYRTAGSSTGPDRHLISILHPPALAYLGVEPGLAGRIRDHFKISGEDCFRVGFMSPLAILPDGQLRISYVIADEARQSRAVDPRCCRAT